MGCWGATRDCFRNCCGGPHSEHYDSWMSRERMRQNNALTQRNEALVRKNAQLEMALTQTQDVLTSYRDLDQFDAISQQDERSMSMTSLVRADSQAAVVPRRSQSSGRGGTALALDRRQASVNVDMPPPRPVPPRVRELSPQHRASRQAQPPAARMLSRPSDELSFVVPAQPPQAAQAPDGPLMRTAPTMYDGQGAKVSPRQVIEQPQKAMDHAQRRAQRKELAAQMQALPDFSNPNERHRGGSPFGAPGPQAHKDDGQDVLVGAHAATHGYAPAPMRAPPAGGQPGAR